MTSLDTSLRAAVRPDTAGTTLALAEVARNPIEHRLDRLPSLIGRGEHCTLRLDEVSVSRDHVRVERQGGELWAWDLQSTNGTFVNTVRIGANPVRLAPGAILRVGDVVLRLVQRPLAPSPHTAHGSSLVGGRALDEVRRMIRLLGPTDLRILIVGQSGTGKELVARELHQQSSSGPFIALNCAALPESLVESELFGHVRGAFTGALRDKPGLFQAARGGTLFLDEVTELPLPLQAKLLRVVETGEVRPVGAVTAQRTDCRVVSATNQDLQRLIGQGRFRGDLAARLAEAELPLPALAERTEDLLMLVEHLTRRAGCSLRLSAEAVEALCCYGWPLNVRELDNLVRMLAAVVPSGQVVDLSQLPTQTTSLGAPARDTGTRAQQVLDALRRNRGNIRRTGQELGVSRSFIYRCLDRSGVNPGQMRGTASAMRPVD